MTAPGVSGLAESDHVSYALALIVPAAVIGALSTIASIQNTLLVSSILRFGTAGQKQGFLSKLIAGRTRGALAVTESSASSDAVALRTRAIRSDGGRVLNGAKQNITSRKVAKFGMVIAVTDSTVGKRGISAFLTPTAYCGFPVERIEHNLDQAEWVNAALHV